MVKKKEVNNKSKTENSIESIRKHLCKTILVGVSHAERLKWLQQVRCADAGVWVQCYKCAKWRFLSEMYDPSPLVNGGNWICQMQMGKDGCNAAEVPQPLTTDCIELIYTKFGIGSLVWGKVRGFPWWPGMIDDCPDLERFYWTFNNLNYPTEYHITFFDNRSVKRKWVLTKYIEPFITGNEFNEFRIRKKNYTTQITAAREIALNALKLDIPERLKKYSFISLYRGRIVTPPATPSVSESDNTEIDLFILQNITLTDKQQEPSKVQSYVEELIKKKCERASKLLTTFHKKDKRRYKRLFKKKIT